MGAPECREVAADVLLAAVARLGDESGALERADVLVDGGEADRVVAGEVGDRVCVAQDHGEDVAAGGVGKGMEERVGLVAVGRTYNHSVIRYQRRDRGKRRPVTASMQSCL